MNRFWPQYVDGMGAVGLLFLRVVAGLGLALHGWPKMQSPFGWMGPGAPVPGWLQALAAISEFGGGLALIVGLLTPLACLGIMSTMFVAVLLSLQKGAPFVSSKPGGPAYELAALYFIIALALLLTGPGKLSLDALLFGKNRKRFGRY